MKGFKFDIVFADTDPIYVLYLGKLVKNTCGSNEQTSIMEIPINIVDSFLKYVKLIEDKKISRTKHPRLCNIVGHVECIEKPKKVTSNNTDTTNEENSDFDDDDIEKTENLAKIAKPRPSKKGGKQKNKSDEESEINMEMEAEKKSRVPRSEMDGSNSDETFEDNLEAVEKEDARTKQVTFEDLEGDVTEEEKDEFLDSESDSTPKKSKTTKNTKTTKQSKDTKDSKETKNTGEEKPKTRRQRRKELEDDGEESRWEPL